MTSDEAVDFDFDKLDTRMAEIWKWIRGWKGFYKVSTYGRIKSVERKVYDSGFRKCKNIASRILKRGRAKEEDYPNVALCRGGVAKTHEVHRLVAEAFIPNPLGLPEVNHKDGDKGNCHVWNLEWTTHAGNMAHASENGLARGGSNPGSSHPGSKLTEPIVIGIRKRKGRTKNAEEARRFHVSSVLIGLIRNRKAWKHI